MSVSAKKFEVNDTELFTDEDGVKKTWYDMQLGMIKIPLETFKALKVYIVTQCKRNKNCSDKIDSWDRSMEELESKIK